MSGIEERIADAIWTELERQADRFGLVDRENGIIDSGVDMSDVATAVVATLGLSKRNGLDDVLTPDATHFWHCWATPWVRTCTCSAPDYQDEHCPIHGREDT